MIKHFKKGGFTMKQSHKESGLNLDIARRYYHVKTIEQYIELLHINGGTYLQLHIADDENYGLESSLLQQTATNAIVTKDVYRNADTHKAFLTYQQMSQIVAFAKKKHIEIIPELDSPGHMQGIIPAIILEKMTQD